MKESTESLLLEYYGQTTYTLSSHVDGHIDWLSGTDDGVNHTDKHEDCKLL